MRLLLFILILFYPASNPNFQKIFGDDYMEAIQYFKKNKTIIEAHFNSQNIDKEIVIPVIFPERIRYSIIRDFVETTAIEIIYIDLGSEYVDFSIGDFQLKPSFAEKIEEYIINSKRLLSKYELLSNYGNFEGTSKRKERVRRLKSQNYQLIYIAAFYDIVNERFQLQAKSKTEKIAFFAAAYNQGFYKEKASIEKGINNKFFPYGTKYKGTQYAYTDVAVDFYLNHYQSIF